MHPNRTENIFVHVKSRTGTVGRCRLYQDYFRFQHFCPCIKMCNGSRNILPEPYFRVSVYINGVNRSTRQTGSRIMNSCLSGRIVSKKPSVSVTIIRLCSSIFPTATICEAQGNCNNRNRPFSSDSAIRVRYPTRKRFHFHIPGLYKNLAAFLFLQCFLYEKGRKGTTFGSKHPQPVVSQHPLIPEASS